MGSKDRTGNNFTLVVPSGTDQNGITIRGGVYGLLDHGVFLSAVFRNVDKFRMLTSPL